MTFALYPYQQLGVKHLLTRPQEINNKPHRLLAHAPGAGKTVQAVVAASKINARSGLIVTTAPEPVKLSWKHHMIESGLCTPGDITVVRTGKDHIPQRPHFVIVNYELLLNDDIFRQVYWGKYDISILDEAHRLKSFDAKISNRVLAGGNNSLIARAYWKWLLSGTIMPNRPLELYPICKVLCPELLKPFNTLEKFGRYFCNGYVDEFGGQHFNGASHIDELSARLKPFMHYLSLEDIYPDIPDTIEKSVYIDIGDYEWDETNTPTPTLRANIGAAKLPYVIEYVRYLKPDTPKLVVYTYHQAVTTGLANDLSKDYGVMALWGGASTDERKHALNRFCDSASGIDILILQMQAGGVALDGIQKVCHHAVFAEPDWSAGGYDQCIGRIRRIGQEKPTTVIKLIAEKTLDEAIDAVRRQKQHVINLLLTQNTQEKKPMAMEDQMKDLTAAIRDLTQAVLAITPGVQQPQLQQQQEEDEPAPKRPPGRPRKDAGAADASTPGVQTPTTGGTEKPAVAPTIEQVRKAALDKIQELINSGKSQDDARAAVGAARDKFGFAKLDDVTPDKRVAVIAAIKMVGVNASDPLAAL